MIGLQAAPHPIPPPPAGEGVAWFLPRKRGRVRVGAL
jgi:hypothetical protein